MFNLHQVFFALVLKWFLTIVTSFTLLKPIVYHLLQGVSISWVFKVQEAKTCVYFKQPNLLPNNLFPYGQDEVVNSVYS